MDFALYEYVSVFLEDKGKTLHFQDELLELGQLDMLIV